MGNRRAEVSKRRKSIEVFVAVLEENTENKELRPFGLGKGDFIVPDDFDAPL